MSTSALQRFRQPEYTGENRCLPCTATNVVIDAALSVAVGFAWAVAIGAYAWLAGAFVFTAGLAAIWLRGYLVPGTPELTKRYFPDWLLRKFEKDPPLATARRGTTEVRDGTDGLTPGRTDEETTAEADSDEPESQHEIDPEVLLLEAGVVAPCETVDDLCLTDGFQSGWHDQMDAVRDEADQRDELAHELDLDTSSIEFEDYGGAFIALDEDDAPIGQWESRAALVADLAAARELSDWIDDWADLEMSPRSQVITGLRIFLETCPECGGDVSAGMETVESCCRSHDVVAANCNGCDARLLEITAPEAA